MKKSPRLTDLDILSFCIGAFIAIGILLIACSCAAVGMDGSSTDPFVNALNNLANGGKISAEVLEKLLDAYREALSTGDATSFWEKAGTFLGSAATGIIGSLLAVYKWRGSVTSRKGIAPASTE